MISKNDDYERSEKNVLQLKQEHTGCPLILWTLCFLQFLGLQSTLDKTFGHFCEAHKILISKMS